MTTRSPADEHLDAAEAIAMAGMVLHDRVGPVPSTAFEHPGRRALVEHWERVGRVALTADVRADAARQGGTTDDLVTDAWGDLDSSNALAQTPARLREAQADLMQRKALREATESLLRVTADYERGNLPTAAVAAAWERKADAERMSGRIQQDDVGAFGLVLDEAMGTLAATHGREVLGLNTPRFKQLAKLLCGLRGLMLLGAGPGVGKTQLTVQLGTDVLSDPKVGLVYLTLEMSKRELGYRLLSMASQIPYRRLRLGDKTHPADANGLRLSNEERAELTAAAAWLKQKGPRIAMFGPGDIGPLEARGNDPSRWYEPLLAMVEDAKRRRGVERALVVVDNLQAVGVEPPHGRPWGSDLDRDRVVIEGLTRLQHDLDDAVLVVSEVAKSSFKDAAEMAAILGTGRNTYRADAVMLLKRRHGDDDRRIDLIIDKGRDGMIRGTVPLTWDENYATLDEVEP